MRMCCGCNKRFEQHRLIRLQITQKTQALMPVLRKEAGRSAWVCYNAKCIRQIAQHPKKLFRSLRTRPNVEHLTSVMHRWILAKIQSQFNQMYRDGVITVSIPTWDSSRFDSNLPHIFPSEMYNTLRLDCLDLTLDSVSTEKCIRIHKHHLLASTIHYTDVLVELKLDSIT